MPLWTPTLYVYIVEGRSGIEIARLRPPVGSAKIGLRSNGMCTTLRAGMLTERSRRLRILLRSRRGSIGRPPRLQDGHRSLHRLVLPLRDRRS